LQVAVTTIDEPSPDDVDVVVQFALSIPEPPALSLQFQLTVTSVLFQPAPFAAGLRVGAAVGATTSGGGNTTMWSEMERRVSVLKTHDTEHALIPVQYVTVTV
jgi:hypothetical protein